MATQQEAIVDQEGVIIEEGLVVHNAERVEIDVQITTAHRYPRSVSRFQQDALAMATANTETAASCFYVLPRKDSSGQKRDIEGPSVRLAEIVGSCWGNLRYAARIVREEDGFVVAQGCAHDLERNVAMTIEVKRRITDKNGRRYSPDMIGVTCNAACSIALRNSIFKVVPKTFIDSIYQAAKKVAVGDQTTLAQRRLMALDYFGKMGVSRERVFAALEKEGIEDVDLKDLERMTGWRTSLLEGDATIDAIFPEPTIQPPKRKSETQAGQAKEAQPQREPGQEG